MTKGRKIVCKNHNWSGLFPDRCSDCLIDIKRNGEFSYDDMLLVSLGNVLDREAKETKNGYEISDPCAGFRVQLRGIQEPLDGYRFVLAYPICSLFWRVGGMDVATRTKTHIFSIRDIVCISVCIAAQE